MALSKIVSSLKPSATLKLNEIANKLKSEGKDIIHLGGGEPEFDIPDSAIKYSVDKLNSKRVKYTPVDGIKKLKEVIVDYLKEIYDFNASLDNIVVSSGAKQAIYNFLLSVVDPGDEVVIIAPYWVSYTEMISMTYANAVVVKPSDGLIPKWSDIEKHITSNTKAIIINSPNNPTGLVYPDELLDEIVGFCFKNNIYLLFDSIYDQLIIDDIKTYSPFKNFDNFEDSNIVLINGVSKAFAMTGFRIGYSVAPVAISKAMSKIQAQVTSCPSEISQLASIGAIKEGRSFTQKLVRDLKRKRDLLVEGLSKIKNIKFIKPQATFYSFVDFSYYEKDSAKISKEFIENIGVVTVAGVEFGMEGYLRISFCGSDDDIVNGVRRIKDWLDKK